MAFFFVHNIMRLQTRHHDESPTSNGPYSFDSFDSFDRVIAAAFILVPGSVVLIAILGGVAGAVLMLPVGSVPEHPVVLKDKIFFWFVNGGLSMFLVGLMELLLGVSVWAVTCLLSGKKGDK